MAGRNTASLTFRLFGVDVNATRTIRSVGVAAAGTQKSLEVAGIQAAKWTAIMSGVGAASLAAGSAIGIGLVGAVGGVGVAFAAQSAQVKKTWGDLGTYLKTQTVAMTKPIQNVLIGLADTTRKTFNDLRPDIAGLFQATAPLVKTLGLGLLDAVEQLTLGMRVLLDAAQPLVGVFADHLGPLATSFADALQNIIAPAGQNSRAFGTLLTTLEQLLPILGSVLGSFVRLGAQIMPVLGPVLVQVGHILQSSLADVLPVIGRALTTMLPALASLFQGLGAALRILAPILPPLAQAFAQIFNAIAPLIPQLASHLTPIIVALLPPLAQLLQSLGPLIPPILKIVDAFLPLAPILVNLATTLVQSMLPALIPFLNLVSRLATQLSGALGQALKDSGPALASLGRSFGQILTAISPLLPVIVQLVIAFTPLITLWTRIAAIAVKTLVPAIQGVAVAAAVAAHGVAVAFKLMSDVVLSAVIGILGAASHLPFIGKKFGEARDAVKDFKNHFDSDMEGVIRETNRAQSEAVRNIGKIGPGIDAQRPRIRTSAQRIADSVQAALNSIGHKVDINVTAHLQSILGKMSQPKLQGQTGMLVPGTGDGDIVPAMLEPGEAVVPRRLVPAVAPFLSAQGVPGFAAGGLVGPPWIYNAQGRPPSVDNIASSIGNAAAQNLGFLVGGFGVGGGIGGLVGVQRWAPVFLAALAMAGQSSAWLGLGLRRLNQESGGNPFAINLWDSNAARGDPSRGLMQVIGSTFASYANGLRGRGIYDPLANIFAAIRYTVARYGTLAAWGRPGGYAMGLDYVPFDNFPALLHKGERVVPAGRNGGDTYLFQVGGIISDRALGDIVRDAIHRVAASNGGRTGL